MVEASLLRIARERNYPYVLQNELPELHACVDCRELTAEHREQLHHISNTLQLGWSAEEYFHFIRDSCKVFFDVFEWSEYIKRVDFSVGTRFHGNLIALLHGVPAVIIAHDSRTLEMCELMKIPHLSLAEIERVDVSDVYDWADFAPFCSAYEELYCSYVDFLEENGIAHVLRPSSPVQAEKSPEDST